MCKVAAAQGPPFDYFQSLRIVNGGNHVLLAKATNGNGDTQGAS